MSRYPHPIIAREGWPFLGIAVALALVVTLWGGFFWALPFWLIALFVLQFFRDPPRLVPVKEGLVLAPADGRVIAIDTVRDPYADRQALKISVFMNVFNVHSNRAPVDGLIEQITYFPGNFVNADLDKASEANERNALLIRTDRDELITCVQVAGLVARRILCYMHAGERLERGQRFGFIRFGSRVDLYLPLHAQPRVGIGEKVFASRDILAELVAPVRETPEASGPELASTGPESGAQPGPAPETDRGGE